MKQAAAPVAVVGSLNVDYIAQVDRLPRPGETMRAGALIRRYGGKGANQALAAARQGAQVALIGALGDDADGRAYRAHFVAQGIDMSGVAAIARRPTGTAWIAVDATAENFIVVAPGSNGALTPAWVQARASAITAARALLLQWEVPPSAVLAALRLAARAGVPVMMNPSPLRAGFPWGRFPLDTVIVNAGEARALFGLGPEVAARRTGAWRPVLERHGIRRLVITRGADATLLLAGAYALEVPTLRVRPVDTVGAGDAFAGTYTARRAEGADLAEAVRAANAAAALATLKPGAQEAIPTRAATARALTRR